MLKKTMIVLILCICSSIFSQTNPDTLIGQLESTTGRGRVLLLNQIADMYNNPLRMIEPYKSLDYAQQALNLSRELGMVAQEIISLIQVGNAYVRLGEFDKAIDHFHMALRINETLGNKPRLAEIYSHIAFIFQYLEETEVATRYNQNALEIYRELNNKDREAFTLLQLGSISRKAKKFDQAKSYYDKALSIYSASNDRVNSIQARVQTGAMYLDKMEFDRGIAIYEEILHTYPDSTHPQLMSQVHNDLAWALLNSGDIEGSIRENTLALELRRQQKNKLSATSSMRNLGYAHYRKGDFLTAKAIYYSCLDSLKGDPTTVASQLMRETVFNLYELFQSTHDYNKALDYHKRWVAIRDSIGVNANAENLAKRTAFYEISQQTQKNHLLQAENEIVRLRGARQRVVIFIAVLICLVLLTTTLVLYYRFKLRKYRIDILDQAVRERTEQLNREIEEKILVSERLRESERELRSILDHVHDAIVIHDREGFVLQANEKIVEITGLSPIEMRSRNLYGNFADSQEDREYIRYQIDRAFNGEPVIFEWESMKPGEDSHVETEIVLTPIDVEQKHLVLACIRDVTGRKSFERKQLELERKNTVLAMAVTASHEINQPLMTLKGNLEMLQMVAPDLNTNPKTMKHIRRIEESVSLVQVILEKFRKAEKTGFDEYAEGEEMVVFDDETDID